MHRLGWLLYLKSSQQSLWSQFWLLQIRSHVDPFYSFLPPLFQCCFPFQFTDLCSSVNLFCFSCGFSFRQPDGGVEDPSCEHHLHWTRAPEMVLFMKKFRDDEVTVKFKDMARWMIMVRTHFMCFFGSAKRRTPIEKTLIFIYSSTT